MKQDINDLLSIFYTSSCIFQDNPQLILTAAFDLHFVQVVYCFYHIIIYLREKDYQSQVRLTSGFYLLRKVSNLKEFLSHFDYENFHLSKKLKH